MTSHRTDKTGIRLLPVTMLQIRRGKSDDLEIIFHITPLKHMLRPIIRTVLLRGHNIYFLLRNKKNYLFELSSVALCQGV